MRDIYKSVKKYNPGKRRKELIVFDDMIADVTSNKRLHPVVTDSFIMDKKLNIYLLFITQSLFLAPKDVRIHIIHLFMINILKKQEIQQIANGHSPDINSYYPKTSYNDTENVLQEYPFLVIDTTLSSNNP